MKQKKPLLILMTAGLLATGAAGLVLADDDDDGWRGGYGEHEGRHGHRENGERGGWLNARADVQPVQNATYSKECSSCHMAYQPGLLPAQAWDQIMAPEALSNHYGDDASLSDELRAQILTYLSSNAADGSDLTRSRAFATGYSASASGTDGLPRITQSRYFLRKHDEIPDRLVTKNPDVGSFSQCNSCHKGAADGVFNEHQVDIPGYGPWED